MLHTLDSLQAAAGQAGDPAALWARLTAPAGEAPIYFHFLTLGALGVSDDLYLRLNARGRPLNDFENFKAWLGGRRPAIEELSIRAGPIFSGSLRATGRAATANAATRSTCNFSREPRSTGHWRNRDRPEMRRNSSPSSCSRMFPPTNMRIAARFPIRRSGGCNLSRSPLQRRVGAKAPAPRPGAFPAVPIAARSLRLPRCSISRSRHVPCFQQSRRADG